MYWSRSSVFDSFLPTRVVLVLTNNLSNGSSLSFHDLSSFVIHQSFSLSLSYSSLLIISFFGPFVRDFSLLPFLLFIPVSLSSLSIHIVSGNDDHRMTWPRLCSLGAGTWEGQRRCRWWLMEREGRKAGGRSSQDSFSLSERKYIYKDTIKFLAKKEVFSLNQWIFESELWYATPSSSSWKLPIFLLKRR